MFVITWSRELANASSTLSLEITLDATSETQNQGMYETKDANVRLDQDRCMQRSLTYLSIRENENVA